jgi:hypothetical protein
MWTPRTHQLLFSLSPPPFEDEERRSSGGSVHVVHRVHVIDLGCDRISGVGTNWGCLRHGRSFILL